MSGFDLDLTGVQAIVESLQKDKCKITRPKDDKERVWNAETSEYEAAEPDLIYEGQCHVWSAKQGAYLTTEGGVTYRVSTYYVDVPMAADKPNPEDDVEILEISEQSSPQLLGLKMKVASLDLFTYATSLTIKCEIRDVVPE